MAPVEQSAHRWEHFRHGADIGVRGWGPTLSSAFEQAAIAMIAVVTDPGAVRNDEMVEITCEAPNADILLFDWLNRLVLEMATRQLIFGKFAVEVQGKGLRAQAYGEPVSRERHQPVVEIKGATMTELSVSQVEPGLWRAQCVVDV